MSPPKKRSAPGFGEEFQAQQNFVRAENKATRLQLQTLVGWYDHAEWIAREFNRTQDPKYLRAFCRHVIAILSAVERGLPR
jgi:hypothetical protein